MAVRFIDTRGLKYPMPQLKILNESRAMDSGEVLEVIADCPTFEDDVRKWCATMGKSLLYMKVEGTAKRCQVQV
jgi:tRNA 2-thiouridine synthesizing protein A